MPLNFPNSPTLGQVYSDGGASWEWDGAAWVVLPAAGPSASGTVQFEFASEIASSAITVLAGAHVEYEAI